MRMYLGDVTCDSAGVCLDTSQIPVSTPTPTLDQLPLTTVNPGGIDPSQLLPATGGTCYPSTFTGPLPPDGVYCATGTGVNPNDATTGIPTSWMLGLAAALGVLVLFSFVGGKH
jgi:hypothetical protein